MFFHELTAEDEDQMQMNKKDLDMYQGLFLFKAIQTFNTNYVPIKNSLFIKGCFLLYTRSNTQSKTKHHLFLLLIAF